MNQNNKVLSREEQDAIMTHKYLWFNRFVMFAGDDNLHDVVKRLEEFFPIEAVPTTGWFSDVIKEYLKDEDSFLKGEEDDPCQYCALYEPNEPEIKKIEAFFESRKNEKTVPVYSREHAVILTEIIKDPVNPSFKEWCQGYCEKEGLTQQEIEISKERFLALTAEEKQIIIEMHSANHIPLPFLKKD